MGYNYNEGTRLLKIIIKCRGLQEPTPIILEVRSRGEGLAACSAAEAFAFLFIPLSMTALSFLATTAAAMSVTSGAAVSPSEGTFNRSS